MSALDDARALIGLPEDEVRRRLGPDAEEDDESEYEGLEDLVELRNDRVLPGSVYLQDGQVALVYLPRAAVGHLDRAEMEEELAGEPVRLRSRAGKKASMYVRPDQGIAYSADAQQVHFVELFPPCSLDDYKAGIYLEPGKFIR